ncbi:MAG: hypothetical protein H6Q07_865 [Acidobacteria bacterium]|nr:hypothetical protein [Acidobacteriota bacterium]
MPLPGRTGKYLLLLLLVIVIFYTPILFSFQFSILNGYDLVAMDYPWYNYMASSVNQGHLPLWDPYAQGGRSFVGESATGGFSPLRWAAVLLLSEDGKFSTRSMHIVFVFLHALAAVLMFALAREFGLSRLAAFFAGFCFSLAGIAGRAGWFDMVESLIWLPFIFLFQLKALREDDSFRRVFYALCAALGIGMTALAGRVHILIMDALFVIAATIFYAASVSKDPGESSRRRSRWLRACSILAIIGIVSFAAAAVQLIPSMEYAREVKRWIGAALAFPATTQIPYAYMSDGLSPRALFAFVFPYIDLGPGEGWFGPYFGILPFFLALIGTWKNRENRWIRFLAGVAIVSFFFSLGSYAYIHRLAYFLVPYLWFAREANRFLYLTHFAGAILAGFGIEAVFSKSFREGSLAGFMKGLGWCVIGGTAVFAVLVLLRRPEANDWIALSFLFLIGDYLLLVAIGRGLRAGSASFLLIAITLCELGAFSWGMRNVIEVRASEVDHLERLRSIGAAVSFVKAQPGLFRVHVEGNDAPNIADTYQVQATAGGMSATALKTFDRLIHQCGRLDLLNVRYVLRESQAPGRVLFEAGGWKVVEHPSGYPRAWLVHKAVVLPAERIFQEACRSDYDLRRVALLEEPLETFLEGNAADGPGQVKVQSYEPNRIGLETRSQGNSLLVLSEMYYPGWVAEVNGVRTRIHMVDGGLRGIVVPAGVSRVVLRYAPRSIAWGAALTLIAFLSPLLPLVARGRTKKTYSDSVI